MKSTFSQRNLEVFEGFTYRPNLQIIEVSSRSPESKNNLLNFQNVNGIIFISFSLTFLIFHVDFFSKVTRKSAGSKDLAFAL